jgi:TonB-dependent SusC/RagA subfamily outer membrane receptor
MGNNKFKKVYLSLCLLISSTFIFSQQVIKGKVLDDRTGDPLIGVTVTIQGTNSGTITDFNGDFQLRISEPVVLQFSYVGYVQHEERVSPQSPTLNVRMREDTRELDEVLVVGYGTQAKASSVASIVQTKGEDLLKVGNLNSLSESLQGKLNGVITINNNAKPGANTADIYIRGKATWGNTSPLTLVDGIERNFNDIDINEIETISVLKDASATAVYGVKGANGVILVTTRRGENLKPTVRFSSNLGVKQFTTNVKFADYLTSIDAYNRAAANEKDWSKQIP